MESATATAPAPAAAAAPAAPASTPTSPAAATPATAAAPASTAPAAAPAPAAAAPAAAAPAAAPAQKSDPVSADSKSSEAVVSGFDQEWAELQKLQDLQEDAEFGSLLQPGEGGAADGAAAAAAAAAANDADKRSVYVGNVDYSATPADLQEHFKGCGPINRITIMVDKFTGHPKGYAYIEFGSELAAQHAVLLSDSTLKDRQIKVVSKRKNIPGMSRGRGGAWRPRGAIPFRGRGRGGGGFRPLYRGRGGAGRGYGRPY